ncbi:MAG TPA: aquaporin [Candidatus Babeliales bacterium]|nr:aquaporin [Candidatus Babeliales bacterium]
MMKRYAMEFVGTFFLTVAISLIGNPIAIGLMLMAMIYIGGHISGAHFNPAITFACFVQKKLDLTQTVKYIVAQSLGALLALCFFMMITNNSFTLDMVPGSPLVAPMAIEGLLIVVLCWVYLVMNFEQRYKNSTIPGFVIGLTLMAIVSAGSLFNPAVAIASIACSIAKEGMFGGMASVMVYIVGPLVGAFVASLLYSHFKTDEYFRPEM